MKDKTMWGFVIIVFVLCFIVLSLNTFAIPTTSLKQTLDNGSTISTDPSQWYNQSTNGKMCAGNFFGDSALGKCAGFNNESLFYNKTTTGGRVTFNADGTEVNVTKPPAGNFIALISGILAPYITTDMCIDMIIRYWSPLQSDTMPIFTMDDDGTREADVNAGDDLFFGTVRNQNPNSVYVIHNPTMTFNANRFSVGYTEWQNVTLCLNSSTQAVYYVNNTELGQNTTTGTTMSVKGNFTFGIHQDTGSVADINISLKWLAIYNGSMGAPLSSQASDTTAPIVSSQSINNTVPEKNDGVQCGVNATDETAIGSVYFEHNLSGKFTNISSILNLNQQSVNFTVNFTNTRSRGNVIGCKFTLNDTSSNTFQSNVTTFTVANTPETFTLAINNTSPRLNYDVQFSAMINDTDNISTVLASWNCSSSGLWINISNMTLNPNALGTNYTINQTIGRVRDNICGFKFYSNDSGSSIFSVSSLTIFTITNTPPNSTTMFNGSDKTYNTNLTLNATTLVDADGDTINYIFLFEASNNPPNVVRQNTTATSFQTNMTNESVYFARVDVTDGFETALGSSVFNVTLDVSVPSCTGIPTNGTYYKNTTNISATCTDNIQLFEINSTIRALGMDATIYNSTNISNLTSTSFIFNTTINVEHLGNAEFNFTQWVGDTKNRAKKMPSSVKASKEKSDKTKSKENVFIFNESSIGLQINLTVLINKTKLEHPKDSQNLNISFELIDGDYFKLTIAYDTSEENQTTIVNFTSNMPIIPVSDQFSTHLLFGNGKDRLSYDSDDAQADFITILKKDDKSAVVEFIPKSSIAKGERLVIDPKIDNLNLIEYSRIIIVDTITPTFISAFNKSTTDNSTTITTATSVNISVTGLSDLYLDRGNFSENCTSSSNSWVNHSISINGNGTYHNVLGNTNFTAGEVCGWKFYAYDKAGNELDPIYTFEIGSPPISTISSIGSTGSGGGSISLSPSTVKQIKENIEQYFINSSCSIRVIPKSIILNNDNENDIIQIRYLDTKVINFSNKLITIGDLKSAIPYIKMNQISQQLFEKLNISILLKEDYNLNENSFAGLLLNFSTCGSHVVPITIEGKELQGKGFTLDRIIEFVKKYSSIIGIFFKDIIINIIDIGEEIF